MLKKNKERLDKINRENELKQIRYNYLRKLDILAKERGVTLEQLIAAGLKAYLAQELKN